MSKLREFSEIYANPDEVYLVIRISQLVVERFQEAALSEITPHSKITDLINHQPTNSNTHLFHFHLSQID